MLRRLVIPGGHLVITTPGLQFPEHKYPFHYWNFGEDAYREFFFDGWKILDFSYLDNAAGKRLSLACIGEKSNE